MPTPLMASAMELQDIRPDHFRTVAVLDLSAVFPHVLFCVDGELEILLNSYWRLGELQLIHWPNLQQLSVC